MNSYFDFSSNITDFIFPGWNVYTAAGVFGTCVAVMFFAIFYECVRLVRRLLHRKASDGLKTKAERVPLHNGQAKISLHKRFSYTLLQSCLYMVQIFFLYMLMLSIMSYNAWIGIAAVVGMGLGYYVTGIWTFEPESETSESPDQSLTQIPPSRSYSSTSSDQSLTSSLSVSAITTEACHS